MQLRSLRLFACLVALVVACSSTSSSPTGSSPADSGTAPRGNDASAPSLSSTAGVSGDSGGPGRDAASPSDANPSNPPDAPPPVDAGPVRATIRVHYPAGTHSISIRGAYAPYNWSTGSPMSAGADDTWTVNVAALTTTLEWKPLLDDATWARGPNYKLHPGETADVYPHFTTVKGQYQRAYEFTSTIMKNKRGVWIYEPPVYLENTRARLPVLYMHDGQNLFDPAAAFGGNTWKVAETLDAASEDGTIAETLVIGPENTADRMSEYTPVADPTDGGGNGDAYLRMLVEELKPKVDAEMRTIADREHTAMMGSSLGGLITGQAGVTHADVFGRVGLMSPSTWWDNRWLLGQVAATPAAPRPLLVYVDSGDSGTSNDDMANTKALAAAYRALGYVDGKTLMYVVQAGAIHNEVYWAQRLPAALAFLLGPGR